MDRSTGSGFACRLKMEQPNVAEDVMVETTADADKGFKGLETIWISHWDFLPKFLSLYYYTTLEGVLGVQRSGQAQETIICLFGLLFFSQN